MVFSFCVARLEKLQRSAWLETKCRGHGAFPLFPMPHDREINRRRRGDRAPWRTAWLRRGSKHRSWRKCAAHGCRSSFRRHRAAARSVWSNLPGRAGGAPRSRAGSDRGDEVSSGRSWGVAGRREDAIDRVTIEPTGAGVSPELVGGGGGGSAPDDAAGFRHRLVDIRCGKNPGGRRKQRPGVARW